MGMAQPADGLDDRYGQLSRRVGQRGSGVTETEIRRLVDEVVDQFETDDLTRLVADLANGYGSSRDTPRTG